MGNPACSRTTEAAGLSLSQSRSQKVRMCSRFPAVGLEDIRAQQILFSDFRSECESVGGLKHQQISSDCLCGPETRATPIM